MKNTESTSPKYSSRKNERGAALVMVMLISFLLMVAAAALVLEASTNTGNVTDATAEQQAYYAAESGIQSAVNVLRANTVPSPLINTSPTPGSTDNKIDYLKAITLNTSNSTLPTTAQCASASPPADCLPRLSRWMPYTGAVVPIGTNSGMSYAVEVRDPDNVSNVIRFNASGYIESQANGATKTWTDPLDVTKWVRIAYIPPSSTTTLNVSTGISAITNFGRFEMTVGPGGGSVPMPPRVRFTIVVNMIEPFNTVKLLRGYIDPGTVTYGNAGNVRLFFDSQTFMVQSSLLALTPPSTVTCNADGTGTPGCGVLRENIFLPAPEGYYRSGYSVIPNIPASAQSLPAVTQVTGTMTAPEPIRLFIKATGYGPKGAVKQLEAVIQKNYFNGLGAPSPLTLIGPRCTQTTATLPCVTNPATSSFLFNVGNSTPITYSGKDVLLRAFLPPVGVTNDPNLAIVDAAVSGMNGSVYGSTSNVADELPYWLSTPQRLNSALQLLKSTAAASGKYYAPGVTPPNNDGTNYGDNATGKGITYVDGDLDLRGDGGGILVVTGKLRFNGAFNWKGLVLVTGPQGFERSGGGNGILQGTMVVAPIDANSLTCTPQGVNCYLSPQYQISGGGNSTLQYNSTNVENGLDSLSNFVKGVAEK